MYINILIVGYQINIHFIVPFCYYGYKYSFGCLDIYLEIYLLQYILQKYKDEPILFLHDSIPLLAPSRINYSKVVPK